MILRFALGEFDQDVGHFFIRAAKIDAADDVGTIFLLRQGFRFGAGEVSRAQNGLVRSYALALASGVSVLAVVFLSTR